MPQPPNTRSDDSQIYYAENSWSPMSAIEDATLNLPSVHHGHPEEFGLLAAGPSPLQFKSSFDGRYPSPTKRSILPLGSPFDLVRLTIFCANLPLTMSA